MLTIIFVLITILLALSILSHRFASMLPVFSPVYLTILWLISFGSMLGALAV